MAGHIRTAMNCWLRAADYYRSAEFWLSRMIRAACHVRPCERAATSSCAPRRRRGGRDPVRERRLAAGIFHPAAEFGDTQPVLISFGGLDSFKDELWFMTGHGAVQRGIAVLLVDGPGQGGALRRHGIADAATTTRCRSASASTGSADGATWIRPASPSAARASAATTRRAQVRRSPARGVHLARRDLGHRAALPRPRRKPRARRPHEVGVRREEHGRGDPKARKPFKLEGVLDEMRAPTSCSTAAMTCWAWRTRRPSTNTRRAKGVKVTLRLVARRRPAPSTASTTTPPRPGADDRLAGRRVPHRPAQHCLSSLKRGRSNFPVAPRAARIRVTGKLL